MQKSFIILTFVFITFVSATVYSQEDKKLIIGKWQYVIDKYMVDPPIEMHLFENDSVQLLTPQFKAGKWRYESEQKLLRLFFVNDTTEINVIDLQKDSLKIKVSSNGWYGTWTFVALKEQEINDINKISGKVLTHLKGEWKSYKTCKVNPETGKGYGKEKEKIGIINFISDNYGVVEKIGRGRYHKFYYGNLSPDFFADSSNLYLLNGKPLEREYYSKIQVYFMVNHCGEYYIRKLKRNRLVIESFYNTCSRGYYQRIYFKR